MHPTPATSPQQPEHRPAPATSGTTGTVPGTDGDANTPTSSAPAPVQPAAGELAPGQPAAGELARLAAHEAGTRLAPAPVRLGDVVPAPEQIRPAPRADFTLTADTRVRVSPDPAARAVAERLADLLRPATGYRLPIAEAPHAGPTDGIALVLAEQPELGPEGYRLDVTPTGVRISAATATGLHHGTQTLRQLLPATIESSTPVRATWTLPGGSILDRPRFPYRGAMLDVARHFFGVDDVLRVIDHLARYKLNHLHLHLTDDQGWRIAVESRPRLTAIGASTAVGGAPGGWYTPADYQRIVAYAAERHLTVVPEIDLPGHTNAALTAHPELAPAGTTPVPYTGTEVGFSYLDPTNPQTYEFVADVLGEVAARTPGPFLHIGGDEAFKVKGAVYTGFVERAQRIVAKLGKTVVGWHQLAPAAHIEGRVLQWWGTDGIDPTTADAVRRGARLILSPGNRAYLDMKYTSDTPIGHDWAGLIDVRRAYDWDPATQVTGVPAESVLGVEAPLWTESVTSLAEIEFMLLPRLPAIAELGWSPRANHDWAAFRTRLAGQGPRWTAAGIAFHRSAEVPWPATPADSPTAQVAASTPRPRAA
ncbi:beta-N-acetylhexosaminidase [Salinispora pacifica]|uniref:beta-N-acetylhexosaminidase n=1 Tax=Salinispora pacifica TaxID=351187 RepID=UPI0004890B56|nr:beta-N-acetylhexosaminidase [Salinispora pacifica]